MTIRTVLADNFKKLKDATPSLRNASQFKERSVLSNGTLGRIANGEVNLGIDHLEPLADAYGIEPWQLLFPDFSPGVVTELPKKTHVVQYSHVAQSIALLVDQVPESDVATRRQMLLAVSRISQEWSERHQSTTPSTPALKTPAKSRQVKT